MRAQTIGLLAALLSGHAMAQTPTLLQRSYHLSNAANDQEANEIFTAVRTMTDTRTAGATAGVRDMTLTGTADQLNLADWIVSQLDRREDSAGTAPIRMNERDGPELTRIFDVKGAANVQDLNERQTAARTLSDVRRLFPITGRKLVVARASEEQLKLIEWLLTQMDHQESSKAYKFLVPWDSADDTVRVFHLPRGTIQDFNEAQTGIRVLTGIRRVYPHAGRRLIIVRATADQASFAEWLVTQFSQELPKSKSESLDYTGRLPDGADGPQTARLFYFPKGTEPQDLLQKTKTLQAAGVPKAFHLTNFSVIGVAGTSVQLARAAELALR